MRATIISFFSLVLILISCFPVRDISTMNMSSQYRSSELYFHPEFIAYNETDSTVKLFIKVMPEEFLFVRQSNDRFQSNIKVRADIIGSYDQTKIIDSTSAEFTFDLNEKSKARILEMDVRLKQTGSFLIHCTLTDVNKGNGEDYFVSLDRSSNSSRQDFLVTDRNNNPLFRNYLSPNDTINILYRDSSVRRLMCRYYNREFPLAAPPFSFDVRNEFDYRPDSFSIAEPKQLKNISFPREGFYHFQADTSVKTGLTLFRFYNGFPDITTPAQMINSLRYLTNKREFEEMKSSPMPKTMVESYWLTHGGNEEKSRLLIKKYYGRVREANKYFTSYTEGWQTDRGMIFVIFGSPGTVYKSAESESWIYGTPNSSLALNFFFVKVNNPFTDNDYYLTRSPSYESNWYRAVEIWRQGRAYNSFN